MEMGEGAPNRVWGGLMCVCVCVRGGNGGAQSEKQSIKRSRTGRANLSSAPTAARGSASPLPWRGGSNPPHTHRYAHPSHPPHPPSFPAPEQKAVSVGAPPALRGAAQAQARPRLHSPARRPEAAGPGPGPGPGPLSAAPRRGTAGPGSPWAGQGRAGPGLALAAPPARRCGAEGRGRRRGGGRGAEPGAHARHAPSCVPANREAPPGPQPMGGGGRRAGTESGWGAERAGLERGRGRLVGAWSIRGVVLEGGAWGGAYRLVGGAECGGAA